MASAPFDPSLHTPGLSPALHDRLTRLARLERAVELARVFPFTLGEDGHLDFDDVEAASWALDLPLVDDFWSKKAHQSALNQTDRDARDRAIASLREVGDDYRLSYDLRTRDGVARRVSEAGIVLASFEGQPTIIHAVLIDETPLTETDQPDGEPHPSPPSGRVMPSYGALESDELDAPTLEPVDLDQLRLAFQPIIDARTGSLSHFEALLRVRSGTGQLMSAETLIRAAERSGTVSVLDHKAFELARHVLMQHSEVKLAINVSGSTISEPDQSEAYLSRLEGALDIAARLTIEMTESAAVEDLSQAAQFAQRVRATGARFAVDDFGAGFTSFSNLLGVQADSLKIDGSLVTGLLDDPTKQAFMRIMVDLAQTFELGLVAERVETVEEARLLRSLHVDYLQGYFFGKPGPDPVWDPPAALAAFLPADRDA